MVAREFRGQSASTEETFSPTTPLVLVKVLMVISLVRNLLMSALDVSDAFLQVWQKENVVVSVPNWVRMAASDPSLVFWQLRKCLPGQRNAATRWNDHLTQLLEELNFTHMQGTIFRHREREIFISAHIDDLFLVANKEDTEKIFNKLSEKLTLKKDGPFGTAEPGRLFHLKRQIDVGEDGIYISPNAKYIPKLAEILEITGRRGKSVPHHQALSVFDAENNSHGRVPGHQRCQDVQVGAGHLSLHSPRKAGYPTNSSSSFELHGTPNQNLTVCAEKTWELPGANPGHEDALPKS